MSERPPDRSSGFTLVETIVSLTVLGVLLVSAFSIAVETYAYVADTDVDYAAQGEATQAFTRLTEILRKTGWNTVGGVTCPQVLAGGSQFQFRVMRDLDGNGYAFADKTGDREWGPKIYAVRLDAQGNLRIFDGTTPVWHLARYTTSIAFATYLQDPTLGIQEIRVTVQTRKFTRRGNPLDYSLSGTIDMRN
jgi:prepilin-type N-terminal cleavage/methylation domain-containing protein